MGDPRSEITFPISPRLALFGTKNIVKNSKKIEECQQLVREANRRIVSTATRLVFSATIQSWIGEVAIKKDAYLSLIQ